MNIADVAQGLSWMSTQEHAFARRFATAMQADFESHGVADTPLIALRLEDVIASCVFVRRIETALNEEVKPEVAKAVAALIETAGKARERLRKAVNELEDACAKAGTPIDGGIADKMKPLLKQAEGVLDDALQFEREKTPSREKHQAASGGVCHE